MGIAKSCDIRIFSNDDLMKLIENPNIEKKIIYFHIHYFKLLKYNLHLIRSKFVLVSGCGDYTNPDDLFNNSDEFLNFINNDKIIKWYSQNCTIDHPKLIKIPIGLDYHTLSSNPYYWGKKALPIEQENELITVKQKSKPFWEREIKCYSNFHFADYGVKFGYSRKDVKNILPQHLVYYEPEQVKRLETWNNQINYAFVISPHGNGLDCHRTWEALILGCVVIVKTSPLDILYTDLPVLIVNDWKEINTELLEKTITDFKNRNFNYEKLFLKYYTNKFRE
jgi:hypothetical protein